jgi:hypothetical protein
LDGQDDTDREAETMATVTLETLGHSHVNGAGACNFGGGHIALGSYSNTDRCCVRVVRIYRNGDYVKKTVRTYCIDCARRLGFDPDAARCDRN